MSLSVRPPAGWESVHQFLAILHELAPAVAYECHVIGQSE